jgi:hypothetical protein
MKIDMMEVLRSVRKPLPRKTGGPHGTEKGKRGYNRKDAKRQLRKEDL